jgi:monofunctional biosynthetic peptidoglycan transglycosylase
MMQTKSNQPSFWKRLFRVSAAAMGIVVGATVVAILLLRWVPPPTSAFMLQQRLSGTAVDYRWTPMDRISPHAALAVIASEDQNFFDHWGIDLKAIVDAIEDNRSRSRPRGASTISQQVVKNLFLWPGRSYVRKAIEVYFTLLMEVIWPKTRILEVYLNIAEMGKGVFGVEAAGQRFFHKPAARLNRREAATLAAILPSPRRMSADRPSDYVIRRTWQIIQQMQALGGTGYLKQNMPDRGWRLSAVDYRDLIVQRPEIIKVAQPEDAAGQQIDDTDQPFAHVHAVNAQQPQEGEQHPGHRVVDGAAAEADACLAVHGGNQKQVDDPADAQQAEGEKVDGARYGFAEVKAVGTGKSENPEDVADRFEMGVVVVHAILSVDGSRADRRSQPNVLHDRADFKGGLGDRPE